MPKHQSLYLLILLSLLISLPAYAQEEPTILLEAGPPISPSPSAEPAIAETAPPALQAGSQRIYLPLLNRPSEIQIRVGTSADPEDYAVHSPASSFAVGITRLYIDVRFLGIGRYQRYMVEVHTPAGKTIKSFESTAFAPNEYERFSICKATFSCGSGEVALDPGSYHIRAYIDQQMVEHQTITIQ